MDTGKIIVGVALGILLAVGVLYGVVEGQGPSPEECQVQRLEAASGARAAAEVDPSC